MTMDARPWFSLSLQLFLFTSLSLATWNRTITVSTTGYSNATCLHGTTYCSLSFALDFVEKFAKESTAVIIQPGNYKLSRSFNFTEIKDFALIGNGNCAGEVEIQCVQNVAVSFENCHDILIKFLTIRECGRLYKLPLRKPKAFEFYAAALVMNSTDLSIISTVFANSRGFGLKLLNVVGTVNINGTVFDKCALPRNSANTLGGAVHLDLSSQLEGSGSIRIVFHNCTFSDTSRGPGLSVFLWNKTADVNVIVAECHFLNNHASLGAGIFLEFHDAVKNNTFLVKNSDFSNNSAKFGAGITLAFLDATELNMVLINDSEFHDNSAQFAGGAVRTFIGKHKTGTKTNIIRHENCKYLNNSAQYGGAVSHASSFYRPISGMDHRQIVFYKCQFTDNKATIGSAIGLASPSPLRYILKAKNMEVFQPYSAVLDSCYITDNKVTIADDLITGVGAVYTFAMPVIFQGNIVVEGNNGTAIVIDTSFLRVYNYSVLRNNRGLHGGALALYGDSKLILMERSTLYFFHNIAQERGGAMFVQSGGPPVVPFSTTTLNTRTCFLGYNNEFDLSKADGWKTNITFDNNKAPLTAGMAFYATTLRGCRPSGESEYNTTAMEWNFVHYYDSNIAHRSIAYQISTDPIRVIHEISDWHVAPSEVFNATVYLLDEKNSTSYGIVRVLINEESSVKLYPSSLFLIQENSHLTNLKLTGRASSTFSVQLIMASGQVVRSTAKWTSLRTCNPGFYQNGNQCTCRKNVLGISECSNNGKTIYLREGYWAGMVGTQFSSHPCPTHYCNFDKHLKSDFTYNKNHMCKGNRNTSSVLCGSCKKGYSVNLGNEKCVKECSMSHLWLLLIFFVVTLLGVLLVLRINVDIFTVYLNVWLYSYQVILFMKKEGQHLDSFISFVIGIANWRIKGVGTCLFDGMTNLTKLYINYILPTYVLLLLLVLAKIARYIHNCYINRNVFRALSTLLILCYTNITLISFNVLHYVSVGGRMVLFVDGDIDFYRDWREHLPLTIIALLWIMFFVSLLPLILLFTPWFLHRFVFLQNFRAIFDTFQGCYKDEYRWFAGFYFICRIAILLMALFVQYGPLKRAILEVLCVIILVVCVYLKPYNENYERFNRLDAILLSNLCFFTIFSSAINSEATEPVQTVLKPVVNTFAYVPLVYLSVLLALLLWSRCRKAQNHTGHENSQGRSSVRDTDDETATSYAVHNAPI